MKIYHMAEFFDELNAYGYEVKITVINQDNIIKIEMEKGDHYIMNCYSMRYVRNDQELCAKIDMMKGAIDMMIKQEAKNDDT